MPDTKHADATDAPDDFDLDAFLPYRIVRLGRAMSEALGAAYADEGVTIPEWRVLAVIAQSDAPTGMASRDVAARTPMDKMAVSRAVSSLEAKELITRTTDDSDRRVAFLKLTVDGCARHKRIAALASAYENKLLAELEPVARRDLVDLLLQLEERAGRVAS